MAALVYMLCALTGALCSILLFRAYLRSKFRLLMWSGTCFALLALNNAILFMDKVVITDTSLGLLRSLSGLVALGFLLYGLIWDAE